MQWGMILRADLRGRADTWGRKSDQLLSLTANANKAQTSVGISPGMDVSRGFHDLFPVKT